MNASFASSSGSMSQIIPIGGEFGTNGPIDPLLFIDCSGENMELTMDSIVALQNNSSKRIESVTFLSNHIVSEAEIIKGIVNQ